MFPGESGARRAHADAGDPGTRGTRPLGLRARSISPGGRITRSSSTMSATSRTPICTAGTARSWMPSCRAARPSATRSSSATTSIVGDGRISKLFVDRKRVRTDRMKLGFDYPYQWSNTGDRIKHWCFLLPIDEQTTRVFFLFYFDALKIPFTPFRDSARGDDRRFSAWPIAFSSCRCSARMASRRGRAGSVRDLVRCSASSSSIRQ